MACLGSRPGLAAARSAALWANVRGAATPVNSRAESNASGRGRRGRYDRMKDLTTGDLVCGAGGDGRESNKNGRLRTVAQKSNGGGPSTAGDFSGGLVLQLKENTTTIAGDDIPSAVRPRARPGSRADQGFLAGGRLPRPSEPPPGRNLGYERGVDVATSARQGTRSEEQRGRARAPVSPVEIGRASCR